MDARFKTLTAGLAVICAMAVGGIARAGGISHAATRASPVAATVYDAGPATPGDSADPAAASDAPGVGDKADTPKDAPGAGDPADAGKTDADSVEKGQSEADAADAQAGSEQPGNDGASGHADEGGAPADVTIQDVAAD